MKSSSRTSASRSSTFLAKLKRDQNRQAVAQTEHVRVTQRQLERQDLEKGRLARAGVAQDHQAVVAL